MLRRSELPESAAELARFLIGKTLVRELTRGGKLRRIAARIVETEAYEPDDAAAHSFIGQTARNRSLFLERGHAYVYFCYGMHYMLNISAEAKGVGAGVLFRAAEPIEGVEWMRGFRVKENPAKIASGPGRLARAMRVQRALDGIDLTRLGELWLGTALRPVGAVGTSVRIGITKEAHRPLRFYERGNASVSGPKRLNA
ncbi:MAG TPA: DNA-3-methyladenine glycosylase [Verrucomicrobiae bacterium]|nr:DNA-3-methyladenine glycosylase [Verrucomicrobiae bacterium]